MNQYTPVEYSVDKTRRFNLRDLLMVFFRRKWIVLGIAVPIIAFGIYGTMTTTDNFTASGMVLIEARYLENPSFKPVIVEHDILMSTASQVAQSIPVAEMAAAALVDSLPRLKAADPLLTAVNTEQDLRALILRNISCGQVGESNILGINFSHRSPDLALLVVAAVTEAYRTYSVESGQNVKALDYYSEQISMLRSEIDSLMAQRVAVFNKAGMTAFKVNNSAGIQQMRHLEYSYHQARSTRQGLEDKYETLISAVDRDPDYVPSTGSQEKTSILSAKMSLDDAVMDLAKLRMSYNDSSVFIIRQEEFVAEARRVFEAERTGIITDLKIELDIARAKELSLFESLERYRTELTAYPEIERQVASIDLQVNSQKDLLKALQIKRGEVRLKAEGDQRISNITPLNEPTVQLNVGGGKKFIYLFFAATIGLVLGLVVALLVDAQDHRIFDRRQAENVLEVPVLGAISPGELPSGKH